MVERRSESRLALKPPRAVAPRNSSERNLIATAGSASYPVRGRPHPCRRLPGGPREYRGQVAVLDKAAAGCHGRHGLDRRRDPTRDRPDSLSGVALLKQRNHLAAHFFAHSTFGKKRAALRRVLFERSVIEFFDLPPALGVHSSPSVLPEYCRPGASASGSRANRGFQRPSGLGF